MSDTPKVKVITPQEAALEALAHTREASLFTKTAVERIETMFEALTANPERRPIRLTQTLPVVTDKSKWEASAIGIVNPSPIKVMVGIAGSTPTIAAMSPSAPPNGMCVLPIRAYDLELGIDPVDQAQLATGDVVIQLFRFQAPQPMYFARLT